MKRAFVCGNGNSRNFISIEQLQEHGKVYACNAVYRESRPDYLIAVDPKMIIEITYNGWHLENEVWTNPNRRYEGKKFENLNYFNPSKGWSSGPTALDLASTHGYDEIYILGFDFMGLENNKRFNNVFADTPNYKKSSDPATFYGNWLRQTETVIKTNPKIQYKRVIASDNFQPKQLNNYRNFTTIDTDFFQKILGVA
jgi:hypothetical protein